MKNEAFFPGTHRRITIGSPTKQCSNGRIVFPSRCRSRANLSSACPIG